MQLGFIYLGFLAHSPLLAQLAQYMLLSTHWVDGTETDKANDIFQYNPLQNFLKAGLVNGVSSRLIKALTFTRLYNATLK